MTETWLLIDMEAIKKAAGNRNFKGELVLPNILKLEKLKNPKETLHELLKTASGLSGRRLAKFNVNRAVHLVADNITDFGLLRNLEAFKEFEKDLKNAIDKLIQS